VVIAGYGPAGASAAIAAHDTGAHVIIVESARRGGGNGRYSGGFLCDLPLATAVEHLDALCFGRTDPRILEVYAGGLHELSTWLGSLGGTTAPFDPPPGRFPASFPSWPHFPAGSGVRYRTVAGGTGRRGEALWDVLDSAVQTRGIEVRYETSAERLEIDPEGSVTGLRITHASGESTLIAQGGVVLACGGFEADPALADAYLPVGPSWPVGHPGRRFADETGYEVHDRLRALLSYLPRNPNRPHLPSWAVFDEAARQAGPLNGLLGTPNDYTWSADNSAEIDRGWIRCADGPGELAKQISVDPAILDGTITAYNAAARVGRDDLFGRSPDTLVRLDTRRLYAIETWPGIAGTTGGPRHDERARVLRPDGQPVPGLYAAGAVSLVWGHLIEHGGGLTDAIVFGRCAGAEAAARAGQSP
jgi:hypothetical protein